MARHIRDEPIDDRSGDQPWHHNHTVVFAAGVLGLVLVVALVITVVQMSDRWSQPASTRTTTVPTLTTTPSTHERTPLIITPSETSTSYTTSVPLSTTEIGVPPPVAETDVTTGSETSTAESSTPTTPPSTSTAATRSDDDEDDDEPTTTRKRPRLNQTRTLSPRTPN